MSASETANVTPNGHRLVVEDMTETVCRLLPDGTFTFVNEAYCRLFGKTREELLGKTWHPVAVVEDLPMIEEKLRLITPGSPVVVIENRVYDAAGQVRWMQFVNRGLFDASGRLTETQSVGRDITERVVAEKKLEESQQRWQFALDSSGFGVWDWNLSQDRIFYSTQWRQMLGYAAQDEVPGNSAGWQTFLHPDDRPGVLSLIGEHLEGGASVFQGEFRLRCKDGSWKWVLGRGGVIERDEHGKPLRMIGTTADISERKAAEEREAGSLQLIAEGAPSSSVLEAIIRTVEAAHPGMRCSVMLVDATGGHLRLKTAPGLPKFFKEAIDGILIGPDSTCCGRAAHSGMRVICADVLADARMESFHKMALEAGMRACWSEPIISSAGKVLGTLACYRSIKHDPSQTEIQKVVSAANLAALAIEREWREHALHISEERYARALRGTTDGLWDWNITTGDVYLSPRWKQMLGFAEGELSNHRESLFMARLHPEDVPKVQAARQEHFERHTPYQVEFRLLTKAREYRWFLARGQADWNERGEAVRMAGTISDIEVRKQAEQALADSERRFCAIFEQAAVGIALIETSTGRFLDVNQRICEINRRTREEMLGCTFMDVTHLDDLAPDLLRMEELKAGRISSFKMEKRNVTPDGTVIWINLTVAPMWRPGEPPLRHIAVVEDITERKLAESNYRRELAYNQALVNNTAAFIVVTDPEGRFVHANNAFFATLGYEVPELIGKTVWEAGILDAGGLESSQQRFQRLLHGEDVPPADMRLRTKSGQWRTVEIRSTSTRRPDGALDRIVTTGTDVTERNRLQREVLRVVEQEQARIGHDLHDGVGQTMTGILVMMEALEADLTGAAQGQARRIHELLKQSVAEVRRMSHGLSPTSVKYRGLDGALNLLAETVRTNFRTPCVCELEGGVCIGSEDKEAHLFRIAQEAVNNALRHGRPRLIQITLRHVSDGECELRVEDDGSGMRKTRKGQGGGIGMRVMEYRANLIGARLTVESAARRGVVVTCCFDCERSSAREKKVHEAVKRGPRKRKA